MRVLLQVTAGPHEGREIAFAGHATFLVGRSPKAHFRLPQKDRYFSRFHFLIEVNPPHCRLVDLCSRNGTAVNGAKVRAADLHDGDQITAGRTRMRVALEGSPARSDTPPPPPPPPASTHGSIGLNEPSPSLPPPAHPGCPGCSPLTAGGRLCPACRALARQTPQPFPGYHRLRELGRGGMGVVHLAVREADGTAVALKTITPAVRTTDQDMRRFVREADILKRLSHPGIVAFRDAGEAGGQFYFAMEYVPGRDAYRLMKEQGPFPVPRAARLGCQLLDALEYAHARRFVHRDVKPDNLLVVPGEPEVARLTDFGLARVYQASAVSGITITGQSNIGGTLAYMPPEQILDFRNAAPAADLYSTAATLYTLLTGRFVFDLEDRGIDGLLAAILADDPVPVYKRRRDLPRGLADVIHQSLEKDPADRHPSAAAMREELREFC
jgi:serine/threonine-protein kinase